MEHEYDGFDSGTGFFNFRRELIVGGRGKGGRIGSQLALSLMFLTTTGLQENERKKEGKNRACWFV